MPADTMPAQEQKHQPGVESKMSPRPEFTPKYPGAGRLKNKVALITGGDSGIGRAVAVAMAREGARAAIVYLDEHKDANETRDLVKREGSDALLLPGDVGDEAFCEAAVDATITQFGRLDILVNNVHDEDQENRTPSDYECEIDRLDAAVENRIG
jgi:NAD(P)-dependent dehydrogenase (short-subunit alcohol dehydrogenase family)